MPATAYSASANANSSCNIYEGYVNRSDTFFGMEDVEGYEGIPQNLAINVAGWLLMVIIFSVIRKKAWNYGRLAVVQRIDDSERKQHRTESEMLQFQTLDLENPESPKRLKKKDLPRLYRYPSMGVHAVPITNVDLSKRSKSDGISTNEKAPEQTHSKGSQHKSSDEEPTTPTEVTKKGSEQITATTVEDKDKSKSSVQLEKPVNVMFKITGTEVDESMEQRPSLSIVPSISSAGMDRSIYSRRYGGSNDDHRYSKISFDDQSVLMDSGYFSWIHILFTLTDSQIAAKSGSDCVIYLSFQRHLVLLAVIMTVTSLLIVLPINIYNGDEPVNTHKITFLQTTMINVSQQREKRLFLCAHETLVIFYYISTLVIMKLFSKNVKFSKVEKKKKSVIIVGIERKFCNEINLRNHLREIYPGSEIKEITLAFDIALLQRLESQRQRAHYSKQYWEGIYHQNLHKDRPKLKPHACGAICPRVCCCCCKSVDAIKYYFDEEVRLEIAVDIEKEVALTKPLGIAFITFRSQSHATAMVNEYSFFSTVCGKRPMSKLSSKLKGSRWHVEYAPVPKDIYWENLCSNELRWYAKMILVNLVLVLIVTFVTTPVFLTKTLEDIYYCKNGHIFSGEKCKESTRADHITAEGGFLVSTVPTFLIWIFAATLPSLVSVTDDIVKFWTKSGENRSRMIKIFSYLIFMIIILPSVGLTSLNVFLAEYLKPESKNKNETRADEQWRCVFTKSNGSFFVNYLITSTFLGTGSELLRLPELILYFFKILFAKSSAEIAAVRESVIYDFPLGSQYAWFMLNFAIFTIFSVVFPIITPFGLMYLVLRYLVDRYNIYFAYGPTKVKKEVHGTAINFALVCMFILQFNLLMYVTTQLESKVGTYEVKAYCTFGFVLICGTFICQVMTGLLISFNPEVDEEKDNVEVEVPIDIIGEDMPPRPSVTSNTSPDVMTWQSTLDTLHLPTSPIEEKGYRASLISLLSNVPNARHR